MAWWEKVNFEIYDVTTRERNNCNTHITQYLKTLRQSDNEICSANRVETFFLKNYAKIVVVKLFLNPFLKNQNWAYIWINSLTFIQFVFIVCLRAI